MCRLVPGPGRVPRGTHCAEWCSSCSASICVAAGVFALHPATLLPDSLCRRPVSTRRAYPRRPSGCRRAPMQSCSRQGLHAGGTHTAQQPRGGGCAALAAGLLPPSRPVTSADRACPWLPCPCSQTPLCSAAPSRSNGCTCSALGSRLRQRMQQRQGEPPLLTACLPGHCWAAPAAHGPLLVPACFLRRVKRRGCTSIAASATSPPYFTSPLLFVIKLPPGAETYTMSGRWASWPLRQRRACRPWARQQVSRADTACAGRTPLAPALLPARVLG